MRTFETYITSIFERKGKKLNDLQHFWNHFYKTNYLRKKGNFTTLEIYCHSSIVLTICKVFKQIPIKREETIKNEHENHWMALTIKYKKINNISNLKNDKKVFHYLWRLSSCAGLVLWMWGPREEQKVSG